MLHDYDRKHPYDCPCQERQRLIHQGEETADQMIVAMAEGDRINVSALRNKLINVQTRVNELNILE